MKINKNSLVEKKTLGSKSTILKEDETKNDTEKATALSDKDILNAKDLQQATVDELANNIQTAAEEENKEITDAEAKKQAKIVKEYEDIIYDPYTYGTATSSAIKDVLQLALKTALWLRRSNIHSNFPNVLLYGQGGSSKTSQIEQFCEEHNIKLWQKNCSQLRLANLVGIPVPADDLDHPGQKIQKHAVSAGVYQLEHPCIVFLDEFNTTDREVGNAVMDLVLGHKLPIAHRVNGEEEEFTYFPNILFVVCALNPPTIANKKRVRTLNGPEMTRFPLQKEAPRNKKDFYKYLNNRIEVAINDRLGTTTKKEIDPNSRYGALLKDPKLKEADVKKLRGIQGIMNALEKSDFDFNTIEDDNDIFLRQDKQGEMKSYVDYRTLSSLLFASDGTVENFKDIVRKYSGFRQQDQDKIFNALRNYHDDALAGNNLFRDKSAGREATSGDEARDNIGDFMNNLGV